MPKQNFEKIKTITRPLNLIAVASAITYLFSPFNYEFLTIVNLSLPIIGIAIAVSYKGVVHIFSDKNSSNPSVNIALLLPLCALMIRTLKDYDIFDYKLVWFPVLLFAVLLTFLLLKFSNSELEMKSKWEKLLTHSYFTVAIALFLFFATLQINCTFDNSKGTIYESKVISRRISKSSKGSTSYIIKLDKWANQEEVDEVHVSKKRYMKLSKNDKVRIKLRDGLLGIPWYYITSK